ncbi:MAG: MarR family winged helix-turn-helix transcriptional regulator [Clostridia bacterium]|nr:MarR family winged helix-turn-helix transcriptional regulator [Clostridia bacterium]
MEIEAQITQSFINMRSSQEYRDYLRAFAQKSFNITQILTYIDGHDANVHPNRMAEDLSITTAQMAVLLNHLEKTGYIERIPDKEDHRRTDVRLTEAGKNYRKELSKKYHAFINEIFMRMGKEDAERFVELFSEFVKTGAQIYSERT